MHGLLYKVDNPKLEGYADSNLAGNYDDCKSTTGYCFLMGGAAISWYSGKQKTVSSSTSNAEYIALAAASREALFLRQLYEEVGLKLEAVPINEDNQSTIAMAKNPVFHGKQKHIRIQYHQVRDEVEQGTITLQYCRTESMIADALTMPLNPTRFRELRSLMGVVEVEGRL
jgi:hypothetical protein